MMPTGLELQMSADIPIEKKYRILSEICRASHFAWREAVVRRCPDVDPSEIVNEMWEITGVQTGEAYLKRLDGSGDLPGDKRGLGRFVRQVVLDPRRGAVGCGVELLVVAQWVEGDQPVGPIEDRPRAAVVGLQPYDLGLGPVLLEPEDVGHPCASPAVDRLVVVAHHAQVALVRRECLDDVAGIPDPPIGNDGNARPLNGPGYIINGSELGNPHAGNDPGSADGTRTDPHLDPVGSGFHQGFGGFGRADVSEYDFDIPGGLPGFFQGLYYGT